MSKQRVLLLGATGHTGNSILRALLKDNLAFEVEALVRPSSAEKPEVQKLKDEPGLTIRVVDIAEASGEELVKVLTGIDVFISAIDMMGQLAQLRLVAAAKQAGVKRFIPCAFITICPPGGIMPMRDALSFPTLPSGKVDYAFLLPKFLLSTMTEIYDGGSTPNMLTDLRDIGPYVALIIKDDRTVNKFVCTYSDVLNQNEIFGMMEEMSGEKIERKSVSASEIITKRDTASATIATDPTNVQAQMTLYHAGYLNSKYVRGDNTPEYARYLGYMDAGELYPEFKPIKFRAFLEELLDGKIEGVPY